MTISNDPPQRRGQAVLYLDSAHEHEARQAHEIQFVSGITTNPKLIADTGQAPLHQLAALLAAFPEGQVFYQPTALDAEEAQQEIGSALELDPSRVVVKLPARLAMFRLAEELIEAGETCAMTGVYSASQAVVAAQIGATWVIPYVDRAARLRPDTRLVEELAVTLRAVGGRTLILAASIKSTHQAVQAFVDGAHAVTAPLRVLEQMCMDPLTEQAVDEFTATTVLPD